MQQGQQGGGKTIIVCEPNIDISDAEKLLEDLRATISAASEIEIDGSKVERIDTAALQLFVSFYLGCQQQGLNVTWVGVSAPMHKAAENLGLEQVLGLTVH